MNSNVVKAIDTFFSEFCSHEQIATAVNAEPTNLNAGGISSLSPSRRLCRDFDHG